MSRNRWMGAIVVAGVMLGFTAAQPARAEESVEEALGAASAVSMYEVQMVLGLSADAFAKKVYEAEQMKQLISEQTKLLENLDEHFKALANLDSVKDEDKKTLKKLSTCVARLKETAQALADYVDDSSKDNADAWQEKRKASYAVIAELMGLDREK